jgi:hypothetical protein
MEELDIKQQFHLLQKEVEAAVSLTEDTKLNLLSAIDTIKIEIEVLKRFLQQYHTNFARQYAELREAVIREVDPEWMDRGTGSKK